MRATNGYVWPASHRAVSNTSAPPIGARLRLNASTDISSFTPEIQKILRAMTADDFEVIELGWRRSGLAPPANLRIVR